MPNPLAGPELFAYWRELNADKSTTPQDRIVLCAVARVGTIPAASSVVKMCAAKNVKLADVESTYIRHADKLARWAA
jgi:hypothetical protein